MARDHSRTNGTHELRVARTSAEAGVYCSGQAGIEVGFVIIGLNQALQPSGTVGFVICTRSATAIVREQYAESMEMRNRIGL